MSRLFFYILLVLALVFASGTILQKTHHYFFEHNANSSRNPGDNYDPGLGRLHNMALLNEFIDSLAISKGLTVDSIPEYVNLVDSVIRLRFYHGLQTFRFTENWLANLSGKYSWFHFGAKVIPDDILKGQMALCSQSTIVFQEFLRQKGFNVRSVLLPGHFCAEVLINGNWQFHDVSLKPSFMDMPSLSAHELAENPKYLQKAYLYSFSEDFILNYDQYFDIDRIQYGKINAFPAPRMAVFHRISHFLSLWGWSVFLILAILIRRFIKN